MTSSAPAAWRRDDPALVSAAPGFPAWFERTAVLRDEWEAFVDTLPLSRLYGILDEARARAAGWIKFADELQRRAARGEVSRDSATEGLGETR